MNAIKLARSCVLAVVIFGPVSALACGELMFTSGKGLPYQSYLAPRPADVLVLADEVGGGQGGFYEGLERAGHRVTLVSSTDAMAQALARQRFDIVITAFEAVDAVDARMVTDTGSLPRVLPVVARSARNSPQVRGRFDQFLLDGASVGQYLTVINRVLADAP